MAHKMGLAIIGTSNKSVVDEMYFLDTTYSWVHNATSSSIKSSKSYKTGSPNPYPLGADIQYYIVTSKAGVSSVFETTNEYPSTDGSNGWTRNVSDVASGQCVNITPTSPTLTCIKKTAYTLQVGDVFFRDGAIAHTGNSYSTSEFPKRIPIGLVTRTSTTTKDQGLGYKHGYVLALKETKDNSQGIDFRTYASITEDEKTSGTYKKITGHILSTTEFYHGSGVANQYTSDELTALFDARVSEIQNDREGLTYTRTALAQSYYNATDFPAFGQVAAFNLAMAVIPDNRVITTNAISEWFLGGTGQYHDADIEFGAMNNYTPTRRYNDEIADFHYGTGSSKANVDALNAYFASKVDEIYYDALDRNITENRGGGNTYTHIGITYWTSTEARQSSYVINWSHDGNNDTSLHWYTRDACTYATGNSGTGFGYKMFKVRCMLAF